MVELDGDLEGERPGLFQPVHRGAQGGAVGAPGEQIDELAQVARLRQAQRLDGGDAGQGLQMGSDVLRGEAAMHGANDDLQVVDLVPQQILAQKRALRIGENAEHGASDGGEPVRQAALGRATARRRVRRARQGVAHGFLAGVAVQGLHAAAPQQGR